MGLRVQYSKELFKETSVELPRASTNVWPGYVAAISSLVLSLLLLAGVLVVSISQASRLGDAYNAQLIRAVVLDQQRQLELQKLRAPEFGATSQYAKPVATSATALVLPSALNLNNLAIKFQGWSEADRTLRDREIELSDAQRELIRLRAKVSLAAAKDLENFKMYRLIFDTDAESMDGAMLAQLRQNIIRDGVPSKKELWQLAAGSKGLDAVAEREIYRLMLAVRSQMQTIGVNGEQVKILIQRELSSQELTGTKPAHRRGEISMTLRREFPKGGM